MHNFSVEDKLKRKLTKIFNKDKKLYKILDNKMEEIIFSKNIEHYKNLRKPMNHLKRVHIQKSFVLVFKYLKEQDEIKFMDLDHHDSIYK